MNSKLILTLPLLICLSACAAGANKSTLTCDHITPGKVCFGNGKAPVLVNTQANVVVDHENVCVSRNEYITFNITPPGKNDAGAVSIVAKDPNDTWLNGTNSPDKKKIEILVPGWVKIGGIHDYAIYVHGESCLDPRVEVLK